MNNEGFYLSRDPILLKFSAFLLFLCITIDDRIIGTILIPVIFLLIVLFIITSSISPLLETLQKHISAQLFSTAMTIGKILY